MTNYFNRLEPTELALSSKVYEVAYSFAQTGNETDYFQIKTGAKTPMIIALEVATSAEPLKVSLLEAPTMTDGTIAVTAYNMRRPSANTATTTFFSNPTYTSGGVAVNIHLVTAGKGGGAITAEAGIWVLKASTNYLLKVEQLTNQATTNCINIVFAEDYPSA